MNQLIERLFELPPRQRVMLLIGVVGVVFFLYAQFIYWPQTAEIERLEENLSTMKAERDRKARLAANLNKARRIVRELEAQLEKAVTQLPDSREIPDLLSNVSGLGRDAGLDIIVFRQRPEVLKEFYAEVPVEMLVRGRYREVQEFFADVSLLERIVNVSDIRMSSPGAVPEDPVVLETSCRATTFRFLTEAERERIAREKKKKKKG